MAAASAMAMPGADVGDAGAAASEAAGSAARVLDAMERVLDEWLVTGIHRAGARKFIKERRGGTLRTSELLRPTEFAQRILRAWLRPELSGR